MIVALASGTFGLVGLWAWPLGLGALEPTLSNATAAGVMVLAAIVGWTSRDLIAAVAAGTGAWAGLAFAWTVTAAIDRREAGDGQLIAWFAWSAIVVVAFSIGATGGWLSERRASEATGAP